MRNTALIQRNINRLCQAGFDVEAPPDHEWVVIHGVELPDPGAWTDQYGNALYHTSILIDIPYDFPMSPPGVGTSHPNRAIHLPLILHNGNVMSDFHECQHDPWRWFCFEWMEWNPWHDDLLTVVALVEASISERVRRIYV
jgi:ubiquitin-protein ligase